jgi:hypothetical protein
MSEIKYLDDRKDKDGKPIKVRTIDGKIQIQMKLESGSMVWVNEEDNPYNSTVQQEFRGIAQTVNLMYNHQHERYDLETHTDKNYMSQYNIQQNQLKAKQAQDLAKSIPVYCEELKTFLQAFSQGNGWMSITEGWMREPNIATDNLLLILDLVKLASFLTADLVRQRYNTQFNHVWNSPKSTRMLEFISLSNKLMTKVNEDAGEYGIRSYEQSDDDSILDTMLSYPSTYTIDEYWEIDENEIDEERKKDIQENRKTAQEVLNRLFHPVLPNE